MDSNIQKLSQSLLLALKTGNPYAELVTSIAEIPQTDLANELHSDDAKKAFWINIYNSYFLILRKDKKVAKPDIYVQKLILVSGFHMSLDEIEHGILRRYRIKKSLGYLPNWIAPKWIKQLAVDTIDYRIHFALNCGAVSCPPIAFYNAINIDAQLDAATLSFLDSEVTLDEISKSVNVSKIFQWYIGDFGGKTGIRKIIHKYLTIDISSYSVQFNDYDYTEDLENFRE